MNKNKVMKIDEFRSIIWSHVMSGKKPSEIALETGRSKQTIFACCQAFLLLRDGNTEELIRRADTAYNTSYSDVIIKLAAETLGIEIPADVQQMMQARNDLRKARAAKQDEETTLPPAEQAPSLAQGGQRAGQAAAPTGAEPAPTPKGNDALYFIRILEELHEQNQLLRDLLDVVIPKWAGDMKDNQNANSDVLAGLLREQGQALDAIRCNTRKRGL